jgi:hypothetical protein
MEYSPTDYTNLCAITTYYKSNKGKDVNNYSPLYNNILNNYREHQIRVLEFDTSVESENVKPGASLQSWSLFLEKATVFGLYQDEKSKFENDKIKSFVCENITEADVMKLWEIPEFEEDFDIIIDSGIENFKEKALFFKRALPKLNIQGFYFMENLKLDDMNEIHLQISDWKEYFPGCEYFLEVVENPLKDSKSPLLIIQKLLE